MSTIAMQVSARTASVSVLCQLPLQSTSITIGSTHLRSSQANLISIETNISASNYLFSNKLPTIRRTVHFRGHIRTNALADEQAEIVTDVIEESEEDVIALDDVESEAAEMSTEQDEELDEQGDSDYDSDGGVRLVCDESGCVLVMEGRQEPTLQEEKKDKPGFLCCGLTGCYYDEEPPPEDFNVIEGTGWRLGYETAPKTEESFCAMVGAAGWSIALTASEFNDFSKLIQMLREGIVTMSQDGIIGRDEVVMQVERGSVWMECSVPKKRLPYLQNFWKFGGRSSSEKSAFDIRFVLTGTSNRRQAEGYWPAEAVMDMLKKVDEIVAAGPLRNPTAELVDEKSPASVTA